MVSDGVNDECVCVRVFRDSSWFNTCHIEDCRQQVVSGGGATALCAVLNTGDVETAEHVVAALGQMPMYVACLKREHDIQPFSMRMCANGSVRLQRGEECTG